MSTERDLHRPRKRFGQNFLHDRQIVQRIIQAIAPQPGQTLVEIGPGQGALTLPLLDACAELTAIELDRDLLEPLQRAAQGRGLLHLVQGDALRIDFSEFAAGRRIRLLGNLPYNISSPLLFHALEHSSVIDDMHFMLQKEVVDRMAAAPGSRTYGRLSVMLQLRCRVEPLFGVPPTAFFPAPKVESAIVRLTPLAADQIPEIDVAHFERLVRAAFGQRRKTLSNALRGLLSAEQIDRAGIDPGARAETIAVEGYVALSRQAVEAA